MFFQSFSRNQTFCIFDLFAAATKIFVTILQKSKKRFTKYKIHDEILSHDSNQVDLNQLFCLCKIIKFW